LLLPLSPSISMLLTEYNTQELNHAMRRNDNRE
jgi:hypothetical protein